MAMVLMWRRFDMVIVWCHAHDVDRIEPDAAFGDHFVCQRPHGVGRSSQQNRFERHLIIERCMGCGYDEIMVCMLNIEQPFRQRAGAVVVHITKAGNAIARFVCFQAVAVDQFSDEVAHRFRPDGIGPVADDGVEPRGEVVIVIDR